MGRCWALTSGSRWAWSTGSSGRRLTRDGEELPVAGDKLRGLLAILLLEAGRPVRVERLVDELGRTRPRDRTPEPVRARGKAAARSRPTVLTTPRSRRARAVTCWRPRRTGSTRRASGGSSRALARPAAPATPARRRRLSRRTVAVARRRARGHPAAIAGLERAELEELRLAALEERIDADLALGPAHELVAELEELVARHPLREGFRAQLMTALYATGRQADALEAYQGARRDLDELGLVPGPRAARPRAGLVILRQDRRSSTGAPTAPGRRHRSPSRTRRSAGGQASPL